jgi:hypothetical protein
MYRLIILLCLSNSLFAQNTKTIKLYDLHVEKKLDVVNRELEAVRENDNSFVRLSERSGTEGIVWIPVADFTNGVIELEMRGKDVFQKSFIGVAFHGQGNTTYDAIYCRPFNFQAKDSVRKLHAIQYIAHPVYTWKKLREEKNGQYEKEIIAAPDPNGWFRLKIVVADRLVHAYINDATKPSLTVEKLTDSRIGKIGLFVGAGSGGDFKSIKIEYAR